MKISLLHFTYTFIFFHHVPLPNRPTWKSTGIYLPFPVSYQCHFHVHVTRVDHRAGITLGGKEQQQSEKASHLNGPLLSQEVSGKY